MSDSFDNSDDDLTGNGNYLPSLPKIYQSIFNKLGISNAPQVKQAPQPAVVPRPEGGMGGFYYDALRAMGFPPPPNNAKVMADIFSHQHPAYLANRPSRPEYVAPNPYTTDNFPARPETVASSPYVTDNFPARPEISPEIRQQLETLYGDSSPTTDFSDRPRPSTLNRNMPPRTYFYSLNTGPYDDRPRPSALNRNMPPRSDFYSLNTGPYNDRPTFVGTNTFGEPASTDVQDMAQSTGRAHLTSPIIPKDASESTGRAHHATHAKKESVKSVESDVSDDDTGPGSLAEAKRLFPGRELQQAIYYTEPPRGKEGGGEMHRLGVGADTSNLNPDYISRIWEPADMSTKEKLLRGAFEKASGGSAGAADKIAREKSVPCHVGLITMAVGGRTDHLPMNVLEGSYVLPADIVSGLGEGNTLAGSKLISNMFTSGPFGVSSKAPTFSPVKTPSLDQYNKMRSLFNMNNLGQINAPEKKSDGGPVMSGNHRPVPIVAAGGEYVIHPDVVRKLGGGDMEKGHDYLDKFVVGVRKHLVKTLSKLPGPRRD